jgi:beta-lactam-binding protein with PASTA domain
MPDLKGKSYLDAVRILTAQQLPKPTPIESDSNWPVGQVFNQKPTAGTDMRGKTGVELSVSRGLPNREPLVAVPDVIGSTRYDASDAIASARLRPMFRSEEQGTRAQGTVTRTEPSVGSMIERGDEVSYWVASGRNVVPSLHWKTPDAARAALGAAGFQLGDTTYSSDQTKAGLVVDQEPSAGSVAPLATAVAIVVSKERATVQVPTVEGKSASDAISTLRSAGLPVTTVVSEGHLARPGVVVGQDPAPGSVLSPGAPVTLHVAGPLTLLLAGGSGALVLVAGAGMTMWQRAERLKITRALLKVRPSFDRNAIDAEVGAVPTGEPAVHVVARLEVGNTQCDRALTIVKKEISHD